MKKFLFACFVLLLTSCGTNYLKLSEKNKEKYQLSKDYNEHNQEHIYLIDSTIALEKINMAKKPILFVMFTSWCSGSKKTVPELLQIEKTKNIQVVLVTPDDWTYKFNYVDYRKELKYDGSIYMIDRSKFRTGNIQKRMSYFASTFTSDITDIGGFPSCVLLDKNGVSLFSGLLDEDGKIRFNAVVDLL